MTNAIEGAIAAAKDQAAQNRDNLPAQVQTNTEISTAYAPAAAKLKTLDDLGASGLNVDHFLSVTEDGLKIKDKNGLIEQILVEIDMQKIAVFEGIKYGGNNAIYVKTYDGVNANTGGLWAAALRKAQMAEPNVRPYMGADLTMVLAEPALSVKGETVADVGTVLGHSTSTTNKANLMELIDAVKAAGLSNEIVLVKVTSQPRTNKNGNNWGVLKFELVGPADSE